jgi:hypothetical protein
MKINKKYHYSHFFLCQKLKSRVSFIQLKPILDILLRGFSLSSCPQHSLKVLLPLLKYVLNCEQNFSFFDISIRINCNRISESFKFHIESSDEVCS